MACWVNIPNWIIKDMLAYNNWPASPSRILRDGTFGRIIPLAE